MAVVTWAEIDRTGSVDPQNHRTYTRRMRVYTDDKTDGPIEIWSAIPIYQWVSYYSVEGESDTQALAKSVDVRPVDGEQFVWDYVVVYDTKPFDQMSIANPLAGGSPPGWGAPPSAPSAPTPPGGTAPESRPWSLRFGTEQTQAAVPPIDVSGFDVRASNGQPYTDLTYDVAIPYLELTIPRLTVDFSKPPYYVNTVNAGTFLGYAAQMVRCTGYEIQSVYEQAYGHYWNVTLKFQIKSGGHAYKVLDAGSYYLDGGVQKRTDKWGNPIEGSVALNGAGGLWVGGPYQFNTFYFYQSTNFNAIL